MKSFLIQCPSCNRPIEVLAVKCGIFRCGVYKKSQRQLGSHAKEEYVKRMLEQDKIYGCGNPFKVDKKSHMVSKCGWI